MMMMMMMRPVLCFPPVRMKSRNSHSASWFLCVVQRWRLLLRPPPGFPHVSRPGARVPQLASLSWDPPAWRRRSSSTCPSTSTSSSWAWASSSSCSASCSAATCPGMTSGVPPTLTITLTPPPLTPNHNTPVVLCASQTQTAKKEREIRL